MKKNILFLLVFLFSFGLFNINFINATTVSTSNCTISSTLRLGSTGEAVACLQTRLGLYPDGKFGMKTKSAVVSWQARKGLIADGIMGAKSRANFVANGSISGNFPPGCQSASGYSSTTGESCALTPTPRSAPAPVCVNGFNPTTGFRCGCTSASGYNSTNGEPCSGATIEPYVSYEINGVKTIGQDQIINVKYGEPVNISWNSNGDYCEGYVYDLTSSWNGKKSASGSEVVRDLTSGKHSIVIYCYSAKYPTYCEGGSLECSNPSHVYAKDDTLIVNVSTAVSTCLATGYDSKTGFRCGCSGIIGYSSVDGSSCSPTPTPAPALVCVNGFNPTTGFKCGCSSVNGYSSTDGAACGNASNFRPGCTSTTSGYSSTNGESCIVN